MAPAETRSDSEAAPGAASFRLLLTRSLFKNLNDALRAPARPAVSRVLRQIRDALRADALDVALRSIDRAWRYLADDSPTFAPLYARLLSLEGRDDNATLRLLQCAIDFSPDPELAALMILALLRLQRIEDARRHLDFALRDYCVELGGLLAFAAGEVMKHPAIDAPGWIGRSPSLESVGELSPTEAATTVDIQVGGATFTQLLRNLRRESPRIFSFDTAQQAIGALLEVSSRGRSLLGSGLVPRLDFTLDGRVQSRGRRLGGWARVGWSPSKAVRLRLEDERGSYKEIASRSSALPSWHWPFAVDLDLAGLRGHRIQVFVEMPDGRWQPLPDSPLLLEPATRLKGRKVVPLTAWISASAPPRSAARAKGTRLIDVIIPVYRSREETLACIDSVLGTIDETARVLVVDDASDDPILDTELDALEADGRVQLLRNAHNLGFVGSVNRGLALHPSRDAVLLNSDTLVFGDWLARLRAAAYSTARVGTVTPLSNSGTIASYPNPGGGALDPALGPALQALAAATHDGITVEVPVGVGFCLYMRRDCLREVGELDAAVFGKGYGEETDFCLRARQRGWSHQLAADVFVYHAGSVSFGVGRNALLDRSQRLLNLRHPGYDRFIAGFLKRDPALGVRRALDERRLLAFEGRFVLVVTLALAGGVDRYVLERCQALRDQGLYPLVLRTAKAGNARRCELWTDALEVPNLRYDIPAQLPQLVALLRELRLDAVEIQHFLHLDARVIDAVRALGLPYDVFVHDYAWICPRVTLIDGTGRYCGEPDVTVCQVCVRRNGSNLGETISVPALRARSAAWLDGARRVIAPSQDTAARLRRYFSTLTIEVRPHSTPSSPTPLAARPHRAALRIALIGAIGTHKGYRVLLDCARDARARRLPLEFVVVGHTENDAPLMATGKVFITGEYQDVEAPHLLQREQPDIAWLPSVWPETWSYALDHVLAVGLPVVAFDIGAIAERLRSAGVGEMLPLGLKPARINDRLLALGKRRPPADLIVAGFVKTAVPRPSDDASMCQNNISERFMTKTSNGKLAQDVKEEGLSASVQVLPLPTGLYLFSVKATGASTARAAGQLSLPAMHVGLGPGVRSEQVEFIAGPSTHGAWLFSASDLLVTKVNGAGATLILTSVRAPGGEVLSIKVERLEERSEALSGTATPAAPLKAPGRPAAVDGIAAAKGKAPAVPARDSANAPLQVHIGAHIRSRGDMNFANTPWAGRVAPGLWIESFSVRPLEHFKAGDLEYKGLTGSGFETPWLSDDKMCGTKGLATPLVGFAIRLKPSPAAAAYDCEYSGYFQSGITVGPMRNGAPCRSSVANDSLEGIQVRIVKRMSASLPEATRKAAAPPRTNGSKPHGKATRKPVPVRANGSKRVVKKPPLHLKASSLARSTRRPTSRRP